MAERSDVGMAAVCQHSIGYADGGSVIAKGVLTCAELRAAPRYGEAMLHGSAALVEKFNATFGVEAVGERTAMQLNKRCAKDVSPRCVAQADWLIAVSNDYLPRAAILIVVKPLGIESLAEERVGVVLLKCFNDGFRYLAHEPLPILAPCAAHLGDCLRPAKVGLRGLTVAAFGKNGEATLPETFHLLFRGFCIGHVEVV